MMTSPIAPRLSAPHLSASSEAVVMHEHAPHEHAPSGQSASQQPLTQTVLNVRHLSVSAHVKGRKRGGSVEVSHDSKIHNSNNHHLNAPTSNVDASMLRSRSIVHDVSFTLERGQVLGIIGESGAGKTMIGRSLMKLLPPGVDLHASTRIELTKKDNTVVDVASLPLRHPALELLRGQDIAMVFQEPLMAFSPLYTVGYQIAESLRYHHHIGRTQARDMVQETLAEMGISNPRRCFDQYVFELSGGMRQRAMLAAAVVMSPNVLVADEPTTALDPTVQIGILDLLARLQRDTRMAIIFITHDLALVARIAQYAMVMRWGNVVEYGSIDQVIHAPQHAYTQQLIRSIPRWRRRSPLERTKPEPLDTLDTLDSDVGKVQGAHLSDTLHHSSREFSQEEYHGGDRDVSDEVAREDALHPRNSALGKQSALDGKVDGQVAPGQLEVLLRADNVTISFTHRQRAWQPWASKICAVNSVSLTLHRGETLALIGESGAGKTTLGRALIRLCPISDGAITFYPRHGEPSVDVHRATRRTLKQWRPQWQMIFQDPYASLSPRMTIYDIIAEPLRVLASKPDSHTIQRQVRLMCDLCQIPLSHLERFPNAFSGGQRQRIGIARALVTHPSVVVCDEPVSSLDVSVQGEIIELLRHLKEEFHVAYLLITHDVAILPGLADRVAVMQHGRVVEIGLTDQILHHPQNPYTQTLMDSVIAFDPH